MFSINKQINLYAGLLNTKSGGDGSMQSVSKIVIQVSGWGGGCPSIHDQMYMVTELAN